MYELTSLLVSRREVARGMWVLSFVAPEIAAAVGAGQFVNLLFRPGPLLRRPFSVYRADGGVVEIVLKPVGEATEQLLAQPLGSSLSMLGPLGRGYTLAPGSGALALVSGGVGIAPMPLAARAARRLGLDVHWVHGARSAPELCGEWEGDFVHWATEDGSKGTQGTVLEAIPPGVSQVLACGPNPMLAALAHEHPKAQVSVETYMGCGTGVCLGCAVPRSGGDYDRACSEGPVYDAGSIDWARLPGHLDYRASNPKKSGDFPGAPGP